MLARLEDFNSELQAKVKEATSELERRYHEVQRMQRSLSHAERLALAGRIMAEVAHEIGTPLHSVAGHLELLRQDLPTSALSDDVRRRLSVIDTQLTRGRAPRRPADRRHRPRTRAGRAAQVLRAVLLDEGRQRPGALHLGPDRARAPRPHRGDEPARPGQHVPRAPAGRRACVMPAATLLVADDDPVARDLLVEVLTREGYRVQAASGGEDCVRIAQAEPCDIALVDLPMPGVDGPTALKRPVTLQPAPTLAILTAFATMETAIDAIRAGAYDYLSKPFRIDEIKMTVRRALDARRLVSDNRQYRHELHDRYAVGKLVGQSAEMVAIYKLVARVAALDTGILIQGETGTGKEMVARAIHYASPRADRPLVVGDCAALPEPPFDSELSGHKRAALTGAVMSRPGLLG